MFILDEGWNREGNGVALEKGGLATVAIIPLHIAIDVKTAKIVGGRVDPTAMNRVGTPERDVAWFHHDIDRFVRIEPGLADGVRPFLTMATSLHGGEQTFFVAAGHDFHGAVPGPLPVDGEPGLDVASRQIPKTMARLSRATILMQPPGLAGARRFPVHLIDDLFEVIPDERLENRQHSRIRADLGQEWIDPALPLAAADVATD